MKDITVRRSIREYIKDVAYDLDGDVDKIMLYLHLLKEQYEGIYYKLMIERYPIECDATEYNLTGYRYETDEEYNARMLAEENRQRMDIIRKAKEDQKELELYKKLKEKYEK